MQRSESMAKDNPADTDRNKAIVASGPKVPLPGGLVLCLDQPLAALSQPHLQAYPVTGEGGETVACGWLPEAGFALRNGHLKKLLKQKSEHVLRPQGLHTVVLPGQKPQQLVITDKPGHPLPLQSQGKPVRYPEEFILKALLPQAAKALRSLDNLGLAHGNIRPETLLCHDDNNKSLLLGECYCLPAQLNQPPAFLPLDRALAEPLARGEGDIPTDLFALGATILVLMTGHDFHNESANGPLLVERLNNGSFMALISNYRLPARIQEVLKGLLADTYGTRWTLNELDLWLAGNKIPVRHLPPARRASRGFPFQGQEHPTINALVVAMGQQWHKAMDTLLSKEFETWLVRSNNSPDVFERMQQTMGEARRNESSLQGPALTAFGLAALFPQASLFMKQHAAAIDGLGPWLANGWGNPDIRSACADMLKSRLPLIWLSLQPKHQPEWVRLQRTYEQLAVIVRKPTPGYGIERALYELNPGLPCQSPLFEGQMVQHPDDVLPGLEYLSGQGKRNHPLFDRHLVAFLASHADEINDDALLCLADTGNQAKLMVGMVTLLALLDAKRHHKPWPQLCQWLNELLQPSINLYRNTERRETVREELEKAAKTGSLGKMLQVIDNPQNRKLDLEEFQAAIATYALQEETLENCAQEMQDIPKSTQQMTERYAPALCGILASLVLGLGFFFS